MEANNLHFIFYNNNVYICAYELVLNKKKKE